MAPRESKTVDLYGEIDVYRSCFCPQEKTSVLKRKLHIVLLQHIVFTPPAGPFNMAARPKI